MRKIIIAISLLLACYTLAWAQEKSLTHWEIKNSSEVEASDKEVSETSYVSHNWYKTTVPSTVLNALVKNGVYPDPRVGMNNYLIPDVSDEFNQKMGLSKYNYLKNGRNPWQDPYWYRTVVDVPRSYKGKRLWLKLYGINYRADVWVNGRLVADKNSIYGMFRRFKLDITRYVVSGAHNCIALKIYQVDHPGIPTPGTQLKFFGPTRGHATDIFKDETLKMSGGWDCAPVVHDRNMGVYQKVAIEATGDALLENPFVVTTLPNGDTSLADVKVRVDVRNVSDKAIDGKLRVSINLQNQVQFPSYTKMMEGHMRPITLSQSVSLAPQSHKVIEFSSADYPQLRIQKPYLWYPNGYGQQYLHHLKLQLLAKGRISDEKELDFGLREVKKELKYIGKEAGLVYYVNGRKVFCKGGWIQPDMLLDDSEKRIYDQMRLIADANVNLIGSEDMPSPDDTWLESCDKYGIMVWHVFLQCWRMYPGTDTEHYPLDHDLAVRDVEDIVLRYRNHPSIISWFGVNEVVPDEQLYRAMKQKVNQLDTTRPYIPTTSISWDVEKQTPYMLEDTPTGTTDDGAPDYGWAPSNYFFDKVREVHLQMFRNELGMPSMPLYSSLKKFIPTVADHKDIDKPYFPLDSIWAEHGAWDVDNYCYRAYDNAIRNMFGDPKDAEQYSQWAQYLNADGYRAMFEAANHRMWDITSGVMIWKLNSCWPDVGWQIYDWYLNPNAAYYFAKKAMEPIHVQLNANDFKLSVVNATLNPLQNVELSAKVIDKNLNVVWQYATKLDTVEGNSYKEMVSVPQQGMYTDPYFVKLELKDAKGKLLSDNLYWFYSQHIDLVGLTTFKSPLLKTDVSVVKKGGEYVCDIQLENNTQQLSFFNQLALLDEKGNELHPVFWSDNFVTLFPGEKKQIRAYVAVCDVGVGIPQLQINNYGPK